MESFLARISKIKLMVLDVDGVLTDGRLYYSGQGESLKVFQVKDGSAIKRLMSRDILVAVITAKSGKALECRLADLGITRYYLGVENKKSQLDELAKSLNLKLDEICYIGDDLNDLECLKSGVLAVCPYDAQSSVRRNVDYMTRKKGGKGVVAEIAEIILNDLDHKASDFHVVIPARYNSSRFPGKPLALINGKPMIQRVYEMAQKSDAKSVIIATDDPRIEKACQDFSLEVVMTSTSHQSGTDRIGEVLELKQFDPNSIVVNVQGDEPFLPPNWINRVAQCLMRHPGIEMATLAAPFKNEDDILNPHLVKVVRNKKGCALYFSRSKIPFNRAEIGGVGCLRHIGIYAYRAHYLMKFVATPPCDLEKFELLEQLRPLWLGMNILVEEVFEDIPHGIDTINDLRALRRSSLPRSPE